jgi:hypothetical protein
MFAGVKCGNTLRGVKVNGGVDVHRVDFRIAQKCLIIEVALFDTELVADFVETRLGPLADGVHLRVGVTLIDGDKLLAEPQTDNGYIDFSSRHVALLCRVQNGYRLDR